MFTPHQQASPRLVINDRLDLIPYDLLREALWSGRFPHYRFGELAAVDDLHSLVPGGAAISRSVGDAADQSVLAEMPGMLVLLLTPGPGRPSSIHVVGRDRDAMAVVIREITAQANARAPTPPDEIDMRMWMSRAGSTTVVRRRVDAPRWESVRSGYSHATRAALATLATRAGVEASAGRMILWHGEPGTGKTTAVRMLAREWSTWCDPHYVTDPEQFFGQPGYLLEVAGTSSWSEPQDRRFRLVIAEDCDEYLRTDAGRRAGASLGRLLNLTDGILGHGLRVLVLLTTNEGVGRLHPAITRPGRCLSEIRFTRLSRAEAAAWLGPDHEPTGDAMTLAEMYELRFGASSRQQALPASEVGFYL